MSEGCIICMVPNEEYSSTAIDPHCTLAYFGLAADIQPWEREVMLSVASQIAEVDTYYKKRPKVNGRGAFRVEPEFNDGNTYAYIDLIDWNVFPLVREMIESKLGMTINRGHGFTPHMTVGYANVWVPDLARPEPLSTFLWDSVQVWIGDERVRYEIN